MDKFQFSPSASLVEITGNMINVHLILNRIAANILLILQEKQIHSREFAMPMNIIIVRLRGMYDLRFKKKMTSSDFSSVNLFKNNN